MSLRWRYGAIRGRDADAWARAVADTPIREMATTLAFAGFSGIYIDRAGYPDRARALETELVDALSTKPVVSADQRQSFFDLASLRAVLHRTNTAEQWKAKEDAALHPLVVDWDSGCSEPEGTPGNLWRWCSSHVLV
jgi:phosphoglycerol transferase